LYEQREISIDETYYDLCKLLSAPLLRGPRARDIAKVVAPLEEAMCGRVSLDPAGRFYLHLPGQGKMEVSLVAEGVRKIAMLAYLAANGSLKEKSALFWDEPETNLNPRLMKNLAQALCDLANRGVQVVAATHSLFMMKELSLLAERLDRPRVVKFFGLRFENALAAIEQGETLSELKTITALDEALAQDDREQDAFLGH
jgi:predicted ATP-binding protein involved in virulence